MERIQKLLSQMATPQSLKTREFTIGAVKGAAVFHPDITDDEVIRGVISALQATAESAQNNVQNTTQITDLKQLADSTIFAAEAAVKESGVLLDILSGDCVVILDKIPNYLVVSAKKWDKRAIAEPPAETVQRGPREGFIEDIKTNLSILARRLRSPAFAVEKIKLGRISQTNVALCYISTVASPSLIKKIREKLSKIDVDAVIDSHYLLPLIEPRPESIFAQAGVTEKPDVAAAKILEGRVAIIVEGSPTVLTIPFLLVEDFQSPEDYYQRNTFASVIRLLRFSAIILAILLPGAYVAVQVFHYGIVPVKFLVTLTNAVKGIPFAPLQETLLVLLLFEIIREASVRMPRAVGMAMSIVGGLVLGDTAVKSGMISPPAVMVVALSSIALYTAPNQAGVVSILRAVFTFLGGLGGIYGIMAGSLFALILLVNFDSFGTPYLAPFAPLVYPDLKDSFFISGTSEHKMRPKSVPNINRRRQK